MFLKLDNISDPVKNIIFLVDILKSSDSFPNQLVGRHTYVEALYYRIQESFLVSDDLAIAQSPIVLLKSEFTSFSPLIVADSSLLLQFTSRIVSHAPFYSFYWALTPVQV